MVVIFILGDRLKELRKNKKLTQEDIGNMFNVVPATVSAWENNTAQPSIAVITELAKYYNVSTDYLFGFNQDDLDNIEKLKIAMSDAGINDLETAMKVLEVFMEEKDKEEEE